jgi:hypothetical protein
MRVLHHLLEEEVKKILLEALMVGNQAMQIHVGMIGKMRTRHTYKKQK